MATRRPWLFAQLRTRVPRGPRLGLARSILQQEVQADAIVQTVNDLDAQGWDLFQIVPAWTFQNANGEATLIAESYHVFAADR